MLSRPKADEQSHFSAHHAHLQHLKSEVSSSVVLQPAPGAGPFSTLPPDVPPSANHHRLMLSSNKESLLILSSCLNHGLLTRDIPFSVFFGTVLSIQTI